MKTHPSDSDNIPSIVINIFPYNNTFVIRSPWNDLFWLQLQISHHPWIMAHDPFWLSEAHGSEPSPYCTKRLQSVMFIIIKHIKDILNFILFSIFKIVILFFLNLNQKLVKILVHGNLKISCLWQQLLGWICLFRYYLIQTE